MSDLKEMTEALLAFRDARDWEQFHNPKNLSMALAAEAGELMEHFLWATPAQSTAQAADPVKRAEIAAELADVVLVPCRPAAFDVAAIPATLQMLRLAQAHGRSVILLNAVPPQGRAGIWQGHLHRFLAFAGRFRPDDGLEAPQLARHRPDRHLCPGLDPAPDGSVTQIMTHLFAFNPFESILFHTAVVVYGSCAGRQVHGKNL